MGHQRNRLWANTRPAVFELRFRIHRVAQRRALHLESNSSPGADRDDVMGRFLDGTHEFEQSVQHCRYLNADPYRISLCGG